jgi:hypothetical protein
MYLWGKEKKSLFLIKFISFFISLVAGFYAGRIYKTIKGSYWKRTAALVYIEYLISLISFFILF